MRIQVRVDQALSMLTGWRPRWRRAGRIGSFGMVSMGMLGALSATADAHFLFPSLGPTAFLMASQPTQSASSPRNTLVGHVTGALCGIGAVLVCGLYGAPDALSAGMVPMRIVAAALALAATGAVLAITEHSHPPAGATTLIVALGLMSTAAEVMVLVLGVVLLVGIGLGFSRLVGTPLPLWSASPHPSAEGT